VLWTRWRGEKRSKFTAGEAKARERRATKKVKEVKARRQSEKRLIKEGHPCLENKKGRLGGRRFCRRELSIWQKEEKTESTKS